MMGVVLFLAWLLVSIGVFVGARDDDAGFFGALFVAAFWPILALIGVGKGLMR